MTGVARALRQRRCLLLSSLLFVGAVNVILRFYRRSFVNFVDASGPRYVGEHAPEAPPFRGQLKVVSWNIRFGEAIDAAIEELRSVDVLQDAHLLLLQEMDEKGVERIAVGATVTVGNADIVAYSVHTKIPVLPNPWRSAQLEHRAQEIAQGGGACIVAAGDFNTFTARSAQALTARMDRLGLAPVDEKPAPSTALARLGFRPDHFFVRGLTPLASGVWAETKASDHFPIWAVLGGCP